VYQILTADCYSALRTLSQTVDMAFLDPPFNQQKEYALHDDDMSEADYWAMMKNVFQQEGNLTTKRFTAVFDLSQFKHIKVKYHLNGNFSAFQQIF